MSDPVPASPTLKRSRGQTSPRSLPAHPTMSEVCSVDDLLAALCDDDGAREIAKWYYLALEGLLGQGSDERASASVHACAWLAIVKRCVSFFAPLTCLTDVVQRRGNTVQDNPGGVWSQALGILHGHHKDVPHAFQHFQPGFHAERAIVAAAAVCNPVCGMRARR